MLSVEKSIGGTHPLPAGGGFMDKIMPPELGNDGFMDKIQQLDCVIPIFSCLDRLTMVSTGAVSRFWNQYTLQFVKNREFTLIKNFTEFLIENLGLDEALGKKPTNESYSSQIESLFKMFSDQTILNPKNLIQVELSIIILREKKIRILGGINKDHLSHLETQSRDIEKPLFFENIFNLALECKKDEIIDDEIKKDALTNLSDKSIESKETYDAFINEIIKLTNTINSDKIKCETLLAISSKLFISESLNINTINELIKVAETINDAETFGDIELKNHALHTIFTVLTYERSYDKAAYDKAIEVAKKIKDYKLADELLISYSLFKVES